MSETILFGGGCFWCTEAVFAMLRGVSSVEPGYSGPSTSPGQAVTYEYVSTGMTPYVEVTKVEYDPDHISLEELLRIFFASHDPTMLNRQGNDVGPQYRSVVFYTAERQREKTQHYIDALKRSTLPAIVTTVEPLDHFYLAEDYHQKYFENHPDATYCRLVIEPKVEKIRDKFGHLLK